MKKPHVDPKPSADPVEAFLELLAQIIARRHVRGLGPPVIKAPKRPRAKQ